MSHKDNADLRNTGEGGWSYTEHELFSVFAPLIGSDGVSVYMAMCRLIPLAAVDSRYPVTMDAIEEASQVSKSQAQRKKAQIVALGMVEETRSASRRPSTYKLHSLRRLALLGVEALKKRLGVPGGDTDIQASAADLDEERQGRAARSRAGRHVPVPAEREEAARARAGSESRESFGVPLGDTEAKGEQNGTLLLQNGTFALAAAGSGTPVSQKEALVSQKGALVSQGDTPFNELELEDRKTDPPTPGGGERVSPGLVLPDPECRPGETGWALNVGIAARWAMGLIGVTKGKTAEVIAEQLGLRCRTNRRETLGFVAELLVGNWQQYQTAYAAGRLKWGPWKVTNFVADGHWQNPLMWPWTQDGRPRGAGIGVHVPETEALTAAKNQANQQRVCAWIESCAAKMRAVLGDVELIARMNDIRNRAALGEAEDAIDLALQDADDAMYERVLTTLTKAEREDLDEGVRRLVQDNCKHMHEKQREQVRQGAMRKRVYGMRQLPRLSLFYSETL